MSNVKPPILKDKITKEREPEVDDDQTTDAPIIPKAELTNDDNIQNVKSDPDHLSHLSVKANNPKHGSENQIDVDEVTERGSEKQVTKELESTFIGGAGDQKRQTGPATSSPKVEKINTPSSDAHCTQEAQSDSLTIQKINAKLTAEILNMQRVMSHMDLQDSVNQLSQLNTMELYNEMIKCVERNLAKVIQKKCSCDTSNWEQFNTDLFNNGGCSDNVPEDSIEIEEVVENTQDLDQSVWNQSDAQNRDPILIRKSKLCEYFGRSGKQSEEDYEEDDENDREAVDVEEDGESHYEEQDNPYEHLTLVTRHVNNKELTRHYEQLEEDYENLVVQIKEGREEIQDHMNTIGNLREEIRDKESQVIELEKKVAVLNKECGELRETLDTLKDENHYQNIIIEGMREENDGLMGTLETYVIQAGNAKNAIDGLLTKLKRSNSALDKINLHNSVLQERLSQMKTKTAELEDENVSKFEQIEQLEKKIKDLTDKIEANEEKYKELVTSTQRKLIGQEKIQKQLKLIITKKNFLINAFRSEVAKNAKDGILLSKIQRSEAMINKMLKEKMESLANVSQEKII